MPGKPEERQTRARKENQKFHPIFPRNEVFRRVKKRKANKCQRPEESRKGESNCPESGPLKNLLAKFKISRLAWVWHSPDRIFVVRGSKGPNRKPP